MRAEIQRSASPSLRGSPSSACLFRTRLILIGVGLLLPIGCASTQEPTAADKFWSAQKAERAEQRATADPPVERGFDPATEPTVEVLAKVVEGGTCVEMDRLPAMFSRLSDSEYRVTLGKIVASSGRDPNESLTHWLILASHYQHLCKSVGAPENNPATYVHDSVPLPESVIDRAIENKQCRFLASVDSLQTWPYEVQMGREVLSRDFQAAEITRRLWVSVLQDYAKTCGARLSRRAKITIEAELERLNRIVGLDDPTLIDLRSKMLQALEDGNEEQIVVFARAVSEREKAIDSRQSAKYDAKLAAIEHRMSEQAASLERVETSKLVQKSGEAAQVSGDVAQTAANVADTARAAQETVSIMRSLF